MQKIFLQGAFILCEHGEEEEEDNDHPRGVAKITNHHDIFP
jgi:hypothetical protein